jgi:D-3-phosphoglycerate dehydrogenase
MTLRILVSEKLADEGITILKNKGFEVDIKLGLTPEELILAIPNYEALIVRSATKATKDVIEAGKKLRVIGRAGVGVDNVDVETATENGIIVCNAPFSNIVSAAEQTFCLMLACARNTPQAYISMKENKWDRAKFMGVELYEKTLAIFGLGRIGGLVAQRARAFGMKVIGYDPYCSPERAEKLDITLYDEVKDIVPQADFITVHLPKTKETIGMFGPDEYAAMKEGVILVNTARGGIYNLDSLADFLAAGKIGAVGIDVYEKEPCTSTPLDEFPNAILTPHLGASTKEAQVRAGVQIAEYVAAGLNGSIVPTAVNMAPVPPEVMDTLGPYVPACQMMGSLIAQISDASPKNIKVTAAGTLTGADLSILATGALGGLLAARGITHVTSVNAEAVAKRHGIKVSTVSIADALEYTSTVTLEADGIETTATLAGQAQTPRIVSLLGYRLEAVPTGNSIVFEYVDRPGVIGKFGTILGDAGINITTMQVGINDKERNALVFMNVEGEVTQNILDQLNAEIDLINLWLIKL